MTVRIPSIEDSGASALLLLGFSNPALFQSFCLHLEIDLRVDASRVERNVSKPPGRPGNKSQCLARSRPAAPGRELRRRVEPLRLRSCTAAPVFRISVPRARGRRLRLNRAALIVLRASTQAPRHVR